MIMDLSHMVSALHLSYTWDKSLCVCGWYVWTTHGAPWNAVVKYNWIRNDTRQTPKPIHGRSIMWRVCKGLIAICFRFMSNEIIVIFDYSSFFYWRMANALHAPKQRSIDWGKHFTEIDKKRGDVCSGGSIFCGRRS